MATCNCNHILKGKLVTRVSSSKENYNGPYHVDPTDEEQILDTSGKVMTDDVSVGAIGLPYVDVSDTTATAADVFEGKYFYTAEGERVEGTGVERPAVSIIETPDPNGGTVLEVIGGLDLSNDTVTPQSLCQGYTAHDKTGAQIVGTVVPYVEPVLSLGAIRPDAEVWKIYARDSLLVADDRRTIPAYSTTTYYIESSSFDETMELPDTDHYDYFVTWRGLIYPIYSTNTYGSGRQEYHMSSWISECRINIPVLPLSGDTTKRKYSLAYNGSISDNLLTYWSSSTNFQCVENNGNGLRLNAPNYYLNRGVGGDPAIYLRINGPTIQIKGNTTYLNQAYWNTMTDARVQYKLQIWRARKGNLNLDGWGITQLTNNISTCAASPSHTLH